MNSDEGLDQGVRTAVAAQQVVDVVQPLGQVVLLAAEAAAGHLDHAPFDEAGELGAALAGVDPGALRDLPRGRRLPQVGQRQVDPPLLGGEGLNVAFEVLRMLVHEVEEIVHQLAEGEPRAEACHDGHEAGVAAGEDFQRPDRLARGGIAPETVSHSTCALLGVERFQRADPEQVVEGVVRMVDLGEAAGGAGEQDDARLGLEDLAQPPAGVAVRHVAEHHVQVLDHQHEPLVLAVGEVEKRAEAAVAEGLVVLDGAQVPRVRCRSGASSRGGAWSASRERASSQNSPALATS